MQISIHDSDSRQYQRLTKPVFVRETALYGILILRTSLGLLFLAHGCLKIFTFTLSGTAEFFETLALPGFMAAPVAFAEIIGGLLLIAGFYARWAALGLFPILLVATFKAHGSNGWLFTNEGGGWEFPAFFAIACVVQFLLGEGAYSLRSYLHYRRQPSKS